jgi:hypothetical protein
MGKILTIEERHELLKWADSFKPAQTIAIWTSISKCLMQSAEQELRSYWGLARTARNQNVPEPIRTAAHQHLFSVRTKIEKWLGDSVLKALNAGKIEPSELLDGTVFGCSLKQGVSFRLPLSSCQPTAHCAGGCYAHDGLDASISTVIRGSLNGVFAQHFEESDEATRRAMMQAFSGPVKRAVVQALRECDRADFPRQARIRMSHVGELTAYPAFANTMAAMIKDLSGGKVAAVVYTRHRNAALLDPKLFVINFTLDEVSLNRRSWAPKEARIVFSAWEGRIRDDVGVNFLEHHHLAHTESSGAGKICPATQPETNDKTCDGVRCDFCFKHPSPSK